jgi:hypothetical protein
MRKWIRRWRAWSLGSVISRGACRKIWFDIPRGQENNRKGATRVFLLVLTSDKAACRWARVVGREHKSGSGGGGSKERRSYCWLFIAFTRFPTRRYMVTCYVTELFWSLRWTSATAAATDTFDSVLDHTTQGFQKILTICSEFRYYICKHHSWNKKYLSEVINPLLGLRMLGKRIKEIPMVRPFHADDTLRVLSFNCPLYNSRILNLCPSRDDRYHQPILRPVACSNTSPDTQACTINHPIDDPPIIKCDASVTSLTNRDHQQLMILRSIVAWRTQTAGSSY